MSWEVARSIKERIQTSENILIVCSRPVDPDSLGTGLTMSWWIQNEYSKKSDIVIFSSIPPHLKDFPGIKEINATQLNNVNFDKYELIILLDSSSWPKLLTNRYKDVVHKAGINKFISIDHHTVEKFHSDIKLTLRKDDICTAKIVYDFFIKDSNSNLTEEVATWIYYALIDDSRNFKNEMYSDVYSFAQTLIDNGARHSEVVNTRESKDSMFFLSFGIQNSEFYPEIKTTILIIDKEKNSELEKIFGKYWRLERIHKYYFEVFMRTVTGYNYGLMFDYTGRGEVVAGWRTRNLGENVSIQKVLKAILM